MNAVSGSIAAGGALAQIWNPDSAQRITVLEFHVVCLFTSGTVGGTMTRRSTARGATPFLTVTPDLDNARNRGKAPSSAFVLELAHWTTAPTLDASDLDRHSINPNSGTVLGSGVIRIYSRPIEVPPGTGLVIASATAITLNTVGTAEAWAVVED